VVTANGLLYLRVQYGTVGKGGATEVLSGHS